MLLAALAAPAWAQDSAVADSGIYFSLGVGGSDGGFSDSSWSQSTFTATEIFQDDFTATGVGSIGYQWMPEGYGGGLRLELEGSYRRSPISAYILSSGGTTTYFDADGHLETIGVMANGFMDMNISESVTAYLGAGVGAVRETRRDIVVDGNPITGKFTHSSAYQLMAGFGYRLSPGMIVGLDFRNMVVSDFNWPDFPATTVNIEFKEVMFMIRLVG